MSFTYSRWDGSQECGPLDPDEVMHVLAGQVGEGSDLPQALWQIIAGGLRPETAEGMTGLHSLLDEVIDQRESELGRYDLDSLLADIERELAQVAAIEREAAESHDAGSNVEGGCRPEEPSGVGRGQDDAAAEIERLRDHDFHDPVAAARFEAVLDRLQRHQLERRLGPTLPVGVQWDEHAAADMLHDLNGLLATPPAETAPDLKSFQPANRGWLPGLDGPSEPVDCLMASARTGSRLRASLSPPVLGYLDRVLAAAGGSSRLREELNTLDEHLVAGGIGPPSRDIPRGSTEVLLEEALELMRRLDALDTLESDLREALRRQSVSGLRSDMVRAVLGDQAGDAIDALLSLGNRLVEAGYAQPGDDGLRLTARGIRLIGQQVVRDVFGRLRRDAWGAHPIGLSGGNGEASGSSKPYQWGDPFLIDLHGTLMNAVPRSPGVPLRLRWEDFDVFAAEKSVRSATVLMLDVSRSMPLRGCLSAAKQVALALHSLILAQFPRDRLEILTFSDFARQVAPESLYGLSCNEHERGTNMQHAFMLARHLLGAQHGGNKQIILVTDGEPTAHLESGAVHFAYPPSPQTLNATLREVQRCTREGIVINTFMLERNVHLTQFVSQITRINSGRAFFASPERLGEYVLLDYVRTRTGQPIAPGHGLRSIH